jgi:hypothetical protein
MGVSPLIRGNCPVCNKNIMNDKKTAYLECGMEFYVKFSDDSIASFSICKDCFKTATQGDMDKIIGSQIINWGIDIEKQMKWYYSKAVHLKIVKWKETKIELTT